MSIQNILQSGFFLLHTELLKLNTLVFTVTNDLSYDQRMQTDLHIIGRQWL
jgi:hypothetical protein